MTRRTIQAVAAVFIGLFPRTLALAQTTLPRVLDRTDYEDHLRAMWLAQVLANWTGRQTEGQHPSPPFLTDADWGGALDFITNQNPWLSDDDTDIEYVYLLLLEQHNTTTLTPRQIADGWVAHINSFIWVSNASARSLIDDSLLPPVTSLNPPNINSTMIDAQLTTEFFGALAPGMPIKALEMADLPIRTTATSFAAHASQFYVVLYSLASQVDQSLPKREQAIWLVEQARGYIPDTSKAADVVDFVLADYIAHPDVNDWERTRDAVYARYQLNDSLNGFRYLNWFESSVNFATGLIALLYGELDYRRTVQIGTLSGWDSDNGTATMAGLIGLLYGSASLEAQFPGIALSVRFNIHRTRPTVPDRLPADQQAQDTFSLMAQRMIPVIEMVVTEAGGLVDSAGDAWLLPAALPSAPLGRVPTQVLTATSANNRVRAQGGLVGAITSHPGNVPCCNMGADQAFRFGLGQASNFKGLDTSTSTFFSSFGSGQVTGDLLTLTLTYSKEIDIAYIQIIEGPHWHGPTIDGGWFDSLGFQARIAGIWTPLSTTPSASLDPLAPWQVIDFVLAQPVQATAVRLIGAVGGGDAFVTLADFDAFAPEATLPDPFDIDADGHVTIDDLYTWHATPADLDASTTADDLDRLYLAARLRWREASLSSSP